MRHTALVFAIAVMLWGCAHGNDAEFAPAEETSIRLSDERFTNLLPTILSREIFCGHQEVATWAGPRGVASVFHLHADAGCVVEDSVETEADLVRRIDWLKEGHLTFEGKARMADSPHGPIWTLPFKRDDRDCFFFKHNFGYESFSNVTASTHLIAGFFCGPPGAVNSEVGVRQFLSGITIVKPYRPRQTRTARVSNFHGAS